MCIGEAYAGAVQPDVELPKGAAFPETPIFEQTAADLGTPFPETGQAGGTADTIWAPAAAGSPGVSGGSPGRRARVRWLAVGAALLLGIIIVVAIALWPAPVAQPQPGSPPATHQQQRDPATHRAVSPAASSPAHARPRPTAARSPAASPAAAATAPAPGAFTHAPPGVTHRPSGRPSKPQ